MHKTLVWFLSREDPLEKDRLPTPVFLGFPVAQLVKNPPAMRKICVWSQGWEDTQEKGTATLPVSWPGDSMDCSPWDRIESDTAEQLLLSMLFNVSIVFFSYRYVFKKPSNCQRLSNTFGSCIFVWVWGRSHWYQDFLDCVCVCVCVFSLSVDFWKEFDNFSCQVFLCKSLIPCSSCEWNCWYWPVLPYFPYNVVKILLLAILLVSLSQEKQILFLFSFKNIFTTFLKKFKVLWCIFLVML